MELYPRGLRGRFAKPLGELNRAWVRIPSAPPEWFCGVVVNMSACHAEDRGFETRQNRLG